MTLLETQKLSKHLCRLLKVPEVQWTLARTPKGNVNLRFNDNNDEFDIMLDSVALPTASTLNDENNIELKKMIEKYLFAPEKVALDFGLASETTTFRIKPVEKPVEAKKRGRPVKHGKKTD